MLGNPVSKLAEEAHRLGQPEPIKNRRDFEENIGSIADLFSNSLLETLVR
jgi:hypothetical protein